MIEIERPNITTVELKSDGSYGKFVIEPLERGYGTTLGNSLRRVLLSSLPGVAATSVKIDGVLHEISVIPNVKKMFRRSFLISKASPPSCIPMLPRPSFSKRRRRARSRPAISSVMRILRFSTRIIIWHMWRLAAL